MKPRRPYLSSLVVRGLVLAFKEPSASGALFGASALPRSDPEYSTADHRAFARARQYVERLAEWTNRSDQNEPGSINAGLAAHKRDADVLREKAALLDELMQPSASTSHRDVSKRWSAIQARAARAAAGASS